LCTEQNRDAIYVVTKPLLSSKLPSSPASPCPVTSRSYPRCLYQAGTKQKGLRQKSKVSKGPRAEYQAVITHISIQYVKSTREAGQNIIEINREEKIDIKLVY
jgi:hypothetical protein